MENEWSELSLCLGMGFVVWPGKRFISEVLELHGYNPNADHFYFTPVYVKEDRQ